MFPIAEKIRKSKKLVGWLWILAGLLFLVSAIMEEGNRTNYGIGIMFLAFGVVVLRERIEGQGGNDVDESD